MQEFKQNMSSSGRDSRGKTGEARFIYHPHSYFPYELELAKREIEDVAQGETLSVSNDSITAVVKRDGTDFARLTYFSEVSFNGSATPTSQYRLEQSFREAKGRRNRQVTRYSVHGLHEYKGKFNPQLARFILNYFGARQGHQVLDPFCGSGTTLVESAFQNITAVGVDMNPLAVFLTNAKLMALGVRADDLEQVGIAVIDRLTKCPAIRESAADPRLVYLIKWFPSSTLIVIERLRALCSELPEWAQTIILSLSSDLVREYSLQEPADLRIRRRMSPLPEISFQDALKSRLLGFCASIRSSQDILTLAKVSNRAVCGDSRLLPETLKNAKVRAKFDFVVTSPPYATALPYIDTQRLSLVWLGLCSAKEIALLDADAVGSRELKGASNTWSERLLSNADNLPGDLAAFCKTLHGAVSKTDGFRRKAAPQLIYRYYADMQKAFEGLHSVTKKGAKLAFVVGSNHTTLGGTKFVINTPADLAGIANQCGFTTREVIRLDTYQRYGLHAKNAVNSENLTIFEKTTE
jgi:16S rRNA G966 N2-methylase RsmD